MPIKWGPQQDHLLLLKILETHPSIKLDTEKVAKAWPTEADEAGPTPRAIKERLTKIRELSKKNGSITHFPIGPSGVGRTAAATNGVNRSAPGAPIFATPIKNGKASNSLPTPSRTISRITATPAKTRKRRSGSMSDSEEAELTDESDFDEFPDDVGNFFKTPNNTSGKMKLRAVPPKKYVVDADEEVGDIGSDDSDVDFNPNADREEKERKARRRRGIVDDFADDC